MKKLMSLGVIAAFALTAWVSADCGSPKCGKSGCPIKAAETKADKVIASLPSLQYKAGDVTVCCGEAAAAKAKETNAPVHYLVGDKAYETESEAAAALADFTEAEVAKLMTVRYEAGGKCFSCPTTAASVAKSHNDHLRYQVAGFSFDSREKADAAAKAVEEAVAKLAESRGDKPATTEAKKSGCCGSAKTATTTGGKSGCCSKGEAQTASAADSKSSKWKGTGKCVGSCIQGKSASVASCQGTGSCAGKDPSQCCPNGRIAAAHDKARVIVQTAAKIYAS